MTELLPITAMAVCLAAAVRSTWSPCGLSMFSTITPLTEAARGRRYTATVRWFVLGAGTGGACLGAVGAALAAAVGGLGLPSRWAAAAAVAACLAAAASDAGVRGLRLPVHHRQVNERWLDEFRPWVYGAGFGWQLGTGLATYIVTSGVYLVIALGALSGSPALALALGTVFGAARGTAIMLGRGITSADAMRAFHRRLALLEPASRRFVIAIESAAAAVLAAGAAAGAGTSTVDSAGAAVTAGVAVLAVAAVAVAALPSLRPSPGSATAPPGDD